MTQAECILSKMLPAWDGDNENQPILSKAQALKYAEKVAWEAWKKVTEHHYDFNDPFAESENKRIFKKWFNK